MFFVDWMSPATSRPAALASIPARQAQDNWDGLWLLPGEDGRGDVVGRWDEVECRFAYFRTRASRLTSDDGSAVAPAVELSSDDACAGSSARAVGLDVRGQLGHQVLG